MEPTPHPVAPPKPSTSHVDSPALPGLEVHSEPLTKHLKDRALPILTDLLIDFFQHALSQNLDD